MTSFLKNNTTSKRSFLLDLFKESYEEDDTEIKMPQDEIWEWEFLHAICDFNGISLNPIYFSPVDVKFNTEHLKRHYYYLKSPHFWGNTYYKFDDYEHDNSEFNFKYGENGVYDFLIEEEGVRYDKKEDMWYIDQVFFENISDYFLDTTEQYGKKFIQKYIM